MSRGKRRHGGARQGQSGHEKPLAAGAEGPVPDSMEKAIIGWLFRSRWRRPLIYVGIVGLLLGWLWSLVPDNVKAKLGESVIGRTETALPERRQNDANLFGILERRDVLDLDQVREVPQSLRDGAFFVSPSIRKTTVQLVRHSAAMTYFLNHSTTSGPSNEIVCLSGQPFDVHQVRDLAGVGEQRLNSFELAINVTGIPIDTPAVLSWQTISWNKFQGLDNQWVSVRIEYPCGKVQLAVDFPSSSGITSREVQLVERQIGSTSSFQPFSGAVHLADSAGNLVEWTIMSPKMNTEYAMRWPRLLFNTGSSSEAPSVVKAAADGGSAR